MNVYAADGGSGSASDPYGISTEADLMEIMFDPSANYELLCDITVDNTPHDTIFSGRLDGNGHSITMNGGESLFSEVSGTVEELALSGSAETAGGLLADRLTGTVTRSMFVGDVSLQDAESGGAIAGSVEGGTVTDCLTDVTVEGTAANAGSIAGKVTNSNISNCFITGSVSAVGGAVAPVIGTAENSQISGIYYDSSVNTAPYGIFVGSGTTAAVDEASLTAAASYPDLAFGSVWTIAEGSTYPMLIACSGAGTESEPYRLHFFDDLQNILTKTYTRNKYYRLENDISGYQAIGYADPVFNGKFDGNGHKLSTLSNIFETIDENGVVENLIRECGSTIKTNGIYGGIANINYGTIRNCHVSCTINAAKDGGGIVGENIGGTVSGCSFEGSVSVSESGAGGIVGYNSYGTIENCVSDARVSAQDHGAGGIVGDNSFGTVKNCRSDGSLRAGTEVGGIAGRLYNGSILTSYSIASVTTDSAAGGIFGTQIENGYVENSYYLKNYNDPDMDAEQSASFGFDEDALYRSSSYAGFDFDNVWAIDEGRDMPVLRSVEGAGTKAQPYIIRFESDIDNIKGQRKLYYELACNISMDGSTGAEFTGALNGNGHTIDGIGTIFETVSDGAYISNIVTNGVARIADSVSNAVIEYCTMYDCVNIAETLGNCTVTGCRTIGSNNNNNRRQSAGGFADTINGGSIKYCSAADKTVSGSSAAGGFAGIISGSDIDSCFAYNVTVTGTAAGGFSGRTDAWTSISNSSAYGAVTAGTYSGAFACMNNCVPLPRSEYIRLGDGIRKML